MNNEIQEIAQEAVVSIKNLDNKENITKAPELKNIIQSFGTKLIEKTYNVQDFGKGLDTLLEQMSKDLPQYANKNNEVNNDMKEVMASSLIDLHLSETYRQEVIAAVTDFKRSAINKEPLMQMVNNTVLEIKDLGLIDKTNDNETLKTIFKNFGKKIIKNTENTKSFGKSIDLLIQEIQVTLPQYTSNNGVLTNTMKEMLAESIMSLNLSNVYREEVIAAVTDFNRLPKVENQISNLREKFVNTSNLSENKFTN